MPTRKGNGEAAAEPRERRRPARAGLANGDTRVSEEEFLRMVAEAAYLRAERRAFAPGAELDDWLAAEAEVAERLRGRVRRERPLEAMDAHAALREGIVLEIPPANGTVS